MCKILIFFILNVSLSYCNERCYVCFDSPLCLDPVENNISIQECSDPLEYCGYEFYQTKEVTIIKRGCVPMYYCVISIFHTWSRKPGMHRGCCMGVECNSDRYEKDEYATVILDIKDLKESSVVDVEPENIGGDKGSPDQPVTAVTVPANIQNPEFILSTLNYAFVSYAFKHVFVYWLLVGVFLVHIFCILI